MGGAPDMLTKHEKGGTFLSVSEFIHERVRTFVFYTCECILG